jgi:hypothetical protein
MNFSGWSCAPKAFVEGVIAGGIAAGRLQSLFYNYYIIINTAHTFNGESTMNLKAIYDLLTGQIFKFEIELV